MACAGLRMLAGTVAGPASNQEAVWQLLCQSVHDCHSSAVPPALLHEPHAAQHLRLGSTWVRLC